MTPACVAVQVCVLCGEDGTETGEPAPGRRLYERLAAAGVAVEAVACMAVCDRPVTLVFRGAGERWSYLVGGADPDRDVTDIVAAARAVAASPQGIPAMGDRPPFFRAGVIARVPPAPV